MSILTAVSDKEQTMTSSQLAEMTGKDKKEVNRQIKAMFADRIDGGEIPPSLDGRGYVVDYHLPELESKMFVAKYDIAYLEKITKFWIDGGRQHAIPQDYSTALRALADSNDKLQLAVATKAEIGSRREATAMATASVAIKKFNKLEIELDKAKDYASIKRMELEHHGIRFNWRLLKSASQDIGKPPVDIFDQNYGTVKAYHIEAWQEAYALDVAA